METTEYTKPEKPLGQRAYGSIPHLPGSRRGPADTIKGRDKHDIITGYVRQLSEPMKARCAAQNFVTPRVLHVGEPISIDKILTMLEPSGHGAQDGVEGAVWRVERKGVVDFLGKYVRPDKVDGKYLETISGNAPIYNWTPAMLANNDSTTPVADHTSSGGK